MHADTLATKHDRSIANEFEELRAEIRRSFRRLAWKMHLAILAETVVVLGFAYFLATHLR